uniref:Uncharacterized protein n=1 Tax=Glaucocystis sp. BBH TaxID=2023628 RepID=A0A3G1IV19_9EUKA|nr:hypothetical protein DUF2869 [Glaucocystis sp. BBH]
MEKILIKRPIRVKILITNFWKEKSFEFFQRELNKINFELERIESELLLVDTKLKSKKQSLFNKKKVYLANNSFKQISNYVYFLLSKKKLLLKEIENLFFLEKGQEIEYGVLEAFYSLKLGNNISHKSQLEIVIKDGWIIKIRH